MEEIKLTIASVKELYQKGKVTPKKLIEQIIQKAEEYEDMNIWSVPPALEPPCKLYV